jgi:hypothetical protein
LTAAEQREQGKKNEKKSTEDPYSFLQDVRDVCSLLLWFYLQYLTCFLALRKCRKMG